MQFVLQLATFDVTNAIHGQALSLPCCWSTYTRHKLNAGHVVVLICQWRQNFFGSSAQNEGVGKKPVAAVPPGRPEQEVAVSGGIMGTGRKIKGESWGWTGS